MSYENVNIKITIDEILDKLINQKSYIIFKLKYNEFIEIPYYDAMKAELIEEECWGELKELDDSVFPTLRWDVECIDLIMETINAVEEDFLEFKQTQLHMFENNESWYISECG